MFHGFKSAVFRKSTSGGKTQECFCWAKIIIGPKMKARETPQQKTEANISVRVINKMAQLGLPKSVKIS